MTSSHKWAGSATEPQDANSIQIGGSHYKKPNIRLQHWDLISMYNIGYLEGCATKYLSRWRDKNGLEDVEKAGHYVQKLIEMAQAGTRKPGGQIPYDKLVDFCADYELWSTDETACCMRLRWREPYELEYARDAIKRTIERAKKEGWADKP
jgi:hypothetical protein